MLEELTCPHCGADLHLRPGATVVHCEYCGADSRLEELAPRATPAPDAAPAGPRSVPVRRAAPFLVAGLLSGVLCAVGIAVAVALPQIRAHSEQQARAAKLREAMSGAADHTKELSDRVQDAVRRHDAEGQRKAQAELESYTRELNKRVKEIWGQQ